jgi:hypothetical protein
MGGDQGSGLDGETLDRAFAISRHSRALPSVVTDEVAYDPKALRAMGVASTAHASRLDLGTNPIR